MKGQDGKLLAWQDGENGMLDIPDVDEVVVTDDWEGVGPLT